MQYCNRPGQGWKKNEAFVIAGDESTMDSTVMTDDDDPTYLAADTRVVCG